MSSGYSGTPIVKKLGIRAGSRILVLNSPVPYADLIDGLPLDLKYATSRAKELDVVHYFSDSRDGLRAILQKFRGQIKPNGIMWVSWPKKASGVPTTLNENIIRQEALAAGLVDVKVCAINETWSGLKLVIPTADRAR